MFKLFQKRVITPEALGAYFNRLPDELNVSWKKDRDLIIGEVMFDGSHFRTQAKTVEDFVFMVNEGLYISNNIPQEYLKILLKMPPKFVPSTEALRQLKNEKSGESKITLNREELITA